MSDSALIVRSAFPAWRTDPYQKRIVDAILQILFASENVQRETKAVLQQIGYLVVDPPSSILWRAPHNRALVLAEKLEALAREIRKGVDRLNQAEEYVAQFDPAEPVEATAA